MLLMAQRYKLWQVTKIQYGQLPIHQCDLSSYQLVLIGQFESGLLTLPNRPQCLQVIKIGSQVPDSTVTELGW
jgi:hypothetical protein